MRLLITGAYGQLGSEIKEIANKFNQFEFTFTDFDTLDITNPDQLEQIINKQKYNYIINCAAYTNVDKAEEEQEKAEELNIKAVRNLVGIANKYSIKLIHISTDYVFDGKSGIPYIEEDTTCPESVYGYTKLHGEEEAAKAIQYLIIRTSWLYSSHGNNFVKTILRIAKENNEIRVVNDQIGIPTYARDLALTILQIIKQETESNKELVNGIFHFSNEGMCSWYDFAVEIVNISRLSCKVLPITTIEYPLPAKRPQHSVLNTNKIKNTFNISIPNWKESVIECIQKINQQ